jgi:hypothetical protein
MKAIILSLLVLLCGAPYVASQPASSSDGLAELVANFTLRASAYLNQTVYADVVLYADKPYEFAAEATPEGAVDVEGMSYDSTTNTSTEFTVTEMLTEMLVLEPVSSTSIASVSTNATETAA